ncbi:hypothetical protein RB628_37890 [Streptomyces sp. ADMS]|uniref:hypothetical protein n=1 Tax=Streptomyces sp. ADMS TaxID=3071415 RepID=UPI00296E5E7B|nr:hypothetical protein [Streptomyces sp. ADMS]MDW4910938.1 hypothetical protein [Streptomyces sp. ADMS]
MSAHTEGETRDRRTRHPIALAIGIGCYVLAVIVGMYLLNDFGSILMAPLWIAHGVMLIVPIRRLGARVSSAGAALFIVIASLFAAYGANLAHDDLTLQLRGETVTATVAKERLDPGQGKGRRSHYVLERQDGTRIPGPEMVTGFKEYEVGQVLTVLADPQGKLEPQTLGEADATDELLSSGGAALAALGCVAWMTWRGSDTAKQRDEAKRKTSSRTQKAYKAVTRNHTTQDEQEEKLREALRTFPADRRGYIKVHPEDFPDVSQQRASRIAWELGLRAEAAGNRGSWRFRETVVEEVPHD